MVCGIHSFNGFRYIQCLLLFLGLFCGVFDRAATAIIVTALSNVSPEEWSFQERQYVISSFYWGYIATLVLGGYLATKFGMKFFFLLSILGTAVLSALSPMFINLGGWKAYAALNILKGLLQGFMYPSIYNSVSKWAPKTDRNIMTIIPETGYSWAQLLSPFISGSIAASEAGWAGFFYLSAALGFVWSVLWWIFGASSPETSRFISEQEKLYISSNQEEPSSLEEPEDKKKPVPWLAILTSPPFLTLIIVLAFQEFGTSFINSGVPQYFNAVFKMNIDKNGLSTSLIQLPPLIMMHVFAIVGHILLKKEIVSLTVLRKSYNTIACVIPTIVYISLTFLNTSQQTLSLVLIAIMAGTLPAQDIAYWINVIDLSPRFSAVLYGIMNTTTSILSLLSPLIIGSIISDGESDPAKWNIIFYTSATIIPVGGIIYLLFGRTTVQPWN